MDLSIIESPVHDSANSRVSAILPQTDFPICKSRNPITSRIQRTRQLEAQQGYNLGLQARAQSNELRELLEANGGFQQVHRVQHGIKARKVVQQALHTLGRSGRALRPVLAPASFIKFGVQVIGAFASKLTGSIGGMSWKCIAKAAGVPSFLAYLATCQNTLSMDCGTSFLDCPCSDLNITKACHLCVVSD